MQPQNGGTGCSAKILPILRFWYRQSPEDMVARDMGAIFADSRGGHGFGSAAIFSGMINLRLDPEGHLLYFQAIPPERQERFHRGKSR